MAGEDSEDQLPGQAEIPQLSRAGGAPSVDSPYNSGSHEKYFTNLIPVLTGNEEQGSRWEHNSPVCKNNSNKSEVRSQKVSGAGGWGEMCKVKILAR